jgi:cholesterol oxidase
VSGVRFTEEMLGFVAFGATGYRSGWGIGRANGTSLMFHLTIDTGPFDSFVRDERRTEHVTGWVGCPALGGDRLPVTRGVFELFAATSEPGATAMRYRLWFASAAGEPLTLVG